MRWRLCVDRRGVAGIEFGLLAPALLGLCMGGIALTLALWTLTILQTTAATVARCAATGSSLCATVTTGCHSSTPAACYAKQVASGLGLTNLKSSEVTVTTFSASGNAFTQVSIAYGFSLAGYTVTLPAKAVFPNQVASWGGAP